MIAASRRRGSRVNTRLPRVSASLCVELLEHALAADLDFALAFAGLGEIISQLHPQPGFGRAAKGLREADGHVRADARLAVNDVVERLAADAENLRALGYGQAQRLKAIIPYNSSRVCGIFHRHGFSIPP